MTGISSIEDEIDERMFHARNLVEDTAYADAVKAYTDLLANRHLTPQQRAQIQSNLAAALCTMAQLYANPLTALPRLQQARTLLEAALKVRQRKFFPQEWALSRVNLAIVCMRHFEILEDCESMFLGHLALDDTDTVFAEAGHADALAWSRAVRARLIALRRDRR